MGKQNKSQKGKRIVLGIVCVLLAITLGVMVAATILADTVLSNMNYVEKGQSEYLSQEEAAALKEQMASEDAAMNATEDEFEVESQPESEAESEVETEAESETETEETTEVPTTVVLSEEEVDLEVEISENIGEDKHITNILLVGQDSQKGIRERSDTMLMVTVNTKKNTITLTSFMRDMYVKIPGYYKQKINAAYMLGGMDLLNETLYENFGIVVDHNVEVNFGQFMDIIEYLGGIDMELTAKEAEIVYKGWGLKGAKAGVVHLDGYGALIYARYRDKAAGDFARTERQRKLLNALIEEYKSADLTTMIGMINEMMGMITTNMTKTEVLNYAVKFFPMLVNAEIVSQRVPFDGTHTNGKEYYYMAMIDEVSVVVPRLNENVEKLTETLS